MQGCDAISLERVAQPGLEARNARARDARQWRLARARLMQAIHSAKTFLGSLGSYQTCNGAIDISQLEV